MPGRESTAKGSTNHLGSPRTMTQPKLLGEALLGLLTILVATLTAIAEFGDIGWARPALVVLLALLLGIGTLYAVVAARRWHLSRAPLKVSAHTDLLWRAWQHDPKQPAKSAAVASYAEMAERAEYALLAVRNEGETDLHRVVARLSFAGRQIAGEQDEPAGTWSAEPGEDFIPGGGRAANLPVGDVHLVIVALGYGADQIWVEVPCGSGPEQLPYRGTSDGHPSFMSHDGNRSIELGRDVALEVTFHGQEVKQRVRVVLSFDGDQPSVVVERGNRKGSRRRAT